MKTLELKLKKDVLIVDLHDIDIKYKPKIIQDSFGFWIYFKITGNKPAKIEIPHTCFDYKNYKDYKFLCKGSELTEEIASELVEMEYSGLYKKSFYIDYDRPSLLLKFAKESFISAVESKEKFWLENPIKIIERGEDTEHNRVLNQNKWQEAEAKTFKNPLIFVKK